MITLSDLHAAQSRLQGVTIRTPQRFPRNVGQPPRRRRTRAACCSSPRTSNPSAPSNSAAPTTKSPRSQKAERKRGVISYSSGNHAQGVAYAARALNVKSVIVMPEQRPADQA